MRARCRMKKPSLSPTIISTAAATRGAGPAQTGSPPWNTLPSSLPKGCAESRVHFTSCSERQVPRAGADSCLSPSVLSDRQKEPPIPWIIRKAAPSKVPPIPWRALALSYAALPDPKASFCLLSCSFSGHPSGSGRDGRRRGRCLRACSPRREGAGPCRSHGRNGSTAR